MAGRSGAGVWGGATTAGEYELWFNSIRIGKWIESWRVRVRRFDDVKPRHNFWGDEVYLDGAYPAKMWEYDFNMYFEEPTRDIFIANFHALHAFYYDVNKSLHVSYVSTIDSTLEGGLAFNYGNCFFHQTPELLVPEGLLLHRAGFISLKFIGNTAPGTI